MHKLIEYACDKLDELEKKAEKGNLSMAETEYAEVLSSLKKNLLKGDILYDEVREMGGEYSGAMRPMSDMGGSHYGMYPNEGGRSYARGGRGGRGGRRGANQYGSYAMDGYSRATEDMVDELQQLMQQAPDDQTRKEFQRLIQKLEQM